jgi:hypothetical protein
MFLFGCWLSVGVVFQEYRTVQNIVLMFEYLESNRYDVSIAIFFDPKI